MVRIMLLEPSEAITMTTVTVTRWIQDMSTPVKLLWLDQWPWDIVVSCVITLTHTLTAWDNSDTGLISWAAAIFMVTSRPCAQIFLLVKISWLNSPSSLLLFARSWAFLQPFQIMIDNSLETITIINSKQYCCIWCCISQLELYDYDCVNFFYEMFSVR